MSPEPWTLIVNSDDGTPKADDFNAGHYEMTSDLVEKIHRQMYGMIWWMAMKMGRNRQEAMAAIINARENSDTGVDIGKGRYGNPWSMDVPNLAGMIQSPKRIIDTRPASPECPNYKKIRANPRSNFYMITCDEGWRTLIVCTDLYENVADWLLDILGRTPYAKKVK